MTLLDMALHEGYLSMRSGNRKVKKQKRNQGDIRTNVVKAMFFNWL
jgi:hypothetical protein